VQQADALLFEFGDHEIEAGQITARPVVAGNEAELHRVAARGEDDRDGRGRCFGRQCRLRAAPGDDHSNPALHQIGRQRRQSIEVIISPAILGRKVAALDKAHLVQAARNANQKSRRSVGCAAIEEADQRQGALLPAHRKRPRHRRAAAVDIATGEVEIERFVMVEDAGRLINPMIVEGQIHGGVAQGIANALYEKVVYDDGGNILTGSLADYLVPTMAEIPELEIHHLETLTEASVTGAKGVGEGGTIGAPAAVLNAVSDALAPFDVGIFEMPITPQRILQLLREAG
jgi:hypothetical protein